MKSALSVEGVGNNMPKARVLVFTDLHKRDTDFKPIGNYVKAIDLVFEDIMNYCVENNVTHVISTGDLYDKGYRSVRASQHHSNQDRKLSQIVNGNFYKCIGNHFFIERDNNPAMYLIQPHDKYTPKEPIFAEEPVIKVVKDVIIEGVQFSFFHFDKEDKMYINRRKPEATKHVGIYHDDTIIPSSIRQRLGMSTHVISDYLNMVFANIDEAVVGHIHIPVGTVNIQLQDRIVPMDIPGSLCICKSDEIHTHVDLPLYDIEDGIVSKQLVQFSLHADKLHFFEKKVETLPKELLNVPSDVARQNASDIMQANLGSYLSIEEFFRQSGQQPDVLEIVRHASQGTLDLKTAVKTYLTRDKLDVGEI